MYNLLNVLSLEREEYGNGLLIISDSDSYLTLLIGLVIGLRFRQVICKTLQPVIHKYNIHHLVPVKEVSSECAKEDITDEYYQSLKEKNENNNLKINKEEVKVE